MFPETLTFISWNTQKFSSPDITRDLQSLIEQHKPDLVFLQEARADQQVLRGMDGQFAESWSYPWPGGPAVGVMTLSNFPPSRVEAVQTRWREFFVTTPKASLAAEYPLPGGDTLLAVNVHLLNFEIWEPFMLRAQLQDLEEIMAQHRGPILLAGDLNTWSETRLALVGEMASRLGLEEVGGIPCGRKTGDLNSTFLHWLFGVDPELPLDRVYSRGFETLSVEVLPKVSSDHRPVLVRLGRDRNWAKDQELGSVQYCADQHQATLNELPESSKEYC